MNFEEWWMATKPAEVDDLKPQFMDCWAKAELASAEYILDELLNVQWTETNNSFLDRLEDYIEELRPDNLTVR